MRFLINSHPLKSVSSLACLIPFRYTSQSNLPDSNVARKEERRDIYRERERERHVTWRTLNHYEVKRFHSRIGGGEEIGEFRNL